MRKSVFNKSRYCCIVGCRNHRCSCLGRCGQERSWRDWRLKFVFSIESSCKKLCICSRLKVWRWIFWCFYDWDRWSCLSLETKWLIFSLYCLVFRASSRSYDNFWWFDTSLSLTSPQELWQYQCLFSSLLFPYSNWYTSMSCWSKWPRYTSSALLQTLWVSKSCYWVTLWRKIQHRSRNIGLI